MAEPQVTFSYQQPANTNHQQGLPPVGAVYSTGPSAYPSQATYPKQQTGYPQPQTFNPSQQTGYPPAPPAGQPLQEKYPPQNETLPPPYQAGPSHVIVTNTANEPVPGHVIVRATQQQQPNDYLVFAILVTIFCCLPCGIVAIMKASNVRSQFLSGNYEAAERSSKQAKMWAFISCACGVVCDCFAIANVFIWGIIGPATFWAAAYDPYDYYWWY